MQNKENNVQQSCGKYPQDYQKENPISTKYIVSSQDIEKQMNNKKGKINKNEAPILTQIVDEEDTLNAKTKAHKNEDEEIGKDYLNYGMPIIFRFLFLHILKLAMKLNRIIKSGRRLNYEDVPELKRFEKVEYITKEIQQSIQEAYDKKIELSAFKMLKIILGMFVSNVLMCVCIICADNSVRLYSSVSMQSLIESITNDNKDEVLKQTIIFSCCVLASGLICQLSSYFSQCLSAKLRLGLVTTLYSKVNSLSQYSIKQADLSKIINIVSNDMNLIEMKLPFIFNTLMAPLTLGVTTWVLIDRHGPLGVIIIIVLMGCLPIQNLISKKASTFISQKNKYSEERIKLTHEIIDGIKMIKMYGWEMAFQKFIKTARSNEMQFLLKQITYNYIAQSVSFASSLISASISFSIIYYCGEPNSLDTAKIFASMQIIMFLRIQIMLFVGFSFNLIHEFKIFLTRFISIISIKNYSMINLDDKTASHNDSLPSEQPKSLFGYSHKKEETLEQFSSRLYKVSNETEVKLQNFSAWWNKEGKEDAVLKNLNIHFKGNKLNAIVGKVGSGKSSLLYSMIKEIPAYRGFFQVKGTVSYSKQEPYIFSGTVRENILFGKPFNQEWYDNVVQSCCLATDFESFSNGDSSEIGEKGINLSGGQKARISLARAVYTNPDILLLDDPLSAVDSKVAKSLVQNVFKELLKDKLIILVTHQISQAKHFDHIVILENGQVQSQGDYASLQDQLSVYSLVDEKEKSLDESQIQINESFNEIHNEQSNKHAHEPTSEVQQKAGVSLFVSEDEKNADVTASTYSSYFKFTKKTCQYIFIVIAFIFSEGVLTAFNRLLAFYDDEDTITKKNLFILLGIITIVFFVGQLIKYISLGRSVIYTNTAIHTKMIEKVVRSPITFFEQTQSGVILNRFTNDMGILDNMIHFTFLDSLEGPLNFINLILTVSFIQPYFLIVGVVEILILYKWLTFNKNAIKQSKVLDLQSKSPVFSFFSQSLQSMETIKVFEQNDAFLKSMCKKANINIRCNMQFWHVSRMFGAYTQYVTSIFSVVGIFLVTQVFDTSSGLVGQSLIYLTLMTDYINWAVRQIISMDSAMSSVSRSFQICDLESEKQLILPSDDQLHNQKWPNKGQVSFENVHLKYRRDLEDTLKGINFKINSGEKVGCVGRTGAGKSSLIECLFRMREGENIEQDEERSTSAIYYDEVDISKVGLHTLRSEISIIPQTPFVFYGTIRRNLDPLETHSEEEILKVLKETQLYDVVQSISGGLLADMTDVSSVFSVGQKQLICLARAILKNSKLIIMDEATANMDMITDQFIQKTIKNKFINSSVLTIAHRLNTVADYDKVLVMDQGKVVEFESPFLLLAEDTNCKKITKNGYFAQLVKHTGESNSRSIFELARNHYIKTVENKQD